LRTFTGYLIIAALLPILITVISMTGSEMKQMKSFHLVLEEKIQINEITLPQSSIIKASNGSVISDIQRPMNRINLSAEDIPLFLKKLFIISEDKHFYDHLGFDFSSIGRALAINIQSNNIEQGASTITQQLARNLFLTTEKSYNRKLSEVLYAYEIERKYTKEEILELYINAIYFQNGAYGIEAAAQLYFKKQTSELSKAQLAFLASIPNNPSLYDPFTNFDRTKKRQERLIDQLVQSKNLRIDEAEKIKAEPIVLNTKEERIDLFPDYVTYVESELKELIAQQEGFTKELLSANEKERKQIEVKLDERAKEVISSGIIINTSLDPTIQQNAKAAVESKLPYKDIEGAAVVINHETQQIVALVGGKQYKKYNFNRGYQAYRQPGSAIKPLLVYAPYFERTNASIDKRVNAGAFCKNGYCPENYGKANYGMVSLERAFIYSYNTPAVRLLDFIGVENGFKDLGNFSFAKVSNRDHVLPAAIGGFTIGISPLELTSAYTVFANNGVYKPARAIDKVTNLRGETLFSWDDAPVQVWSKATTDKINHLLKKTVQSGTARKASIPNQYSSGKTGTTNDFQDYWYIGLTDQYTAGVWVGKDQPQSIQFIEAAAPQQQIWKEIMTGIK